VPRWQHLVGCAWFWVWALVGAGAALSFVSYLGTLTALPVAVVALLLMMSPTIRQSAFGIVTGAGALLLYVGWIHRSGEFLDPRPWFAIGSAFLVVGILGHAVRARR
jgi:hypothetical protein